jgi:hypothetical protein
MCIASASWGELRPDPFRQTGRGRGARQLGRRHKTAAPIKLKTPAGGGRGFREDEQGENSIVQEISNSIDQ